MSHSTAIQSGSTTCAVRRALSLKTAGRQTSPLPQHPVKKYSGVCFSGERRQEGSMWLILAGLRRVTRSWNTCEKQFPEPCTGNSYENSGMFTTERPRSDIRLKHRWYKMTSTLSFFLCVVSCMVVCPHTVELFSCFCLAQTCSTESGSLLHLIKFCCQLHLSRPILYSGHKEPRKCF